MEDVADFYAATHSNGPADFDIEYPKEPMCLSLRQCWAVARAIDQCTCKINDKNIVTHIPRHYIDALSRLYITENHARTQTSGGVFDSGTMGAEMPGDLVNTSTVLDEDGETQLCYPFGDVPDSTVLGTDVNIMHAVHADAEFYNRGHYKRCFKLFKLLTKGDPLADVAADVDERFPADGTILELWEPIPIVPFAMFPKFQGGSNISYARKIEVNMKMSRELLVKIFFGVTSPNFPTPKVKMLEPRAYIHQQGIDPDFRVPRSMPTHHCSIVAFDIDRTSDHPLTKGETDWLKYDIAPESDKAWFYCARQSYSLDFPTEHFLGMDKIEIMTPKTHMYLDARQLYDLWRAEGVNNDLTFEDWRDTKAVCVLDCKKLQLFRRVQFKVYWRNAWKIHARYNRDAVRYDDDASVKYEARLIFSGTSEFYA